MNKCKDCDTALKPLFGSKWYCPNDCDRKTKTTTTASECSKRWWWWASSCRLNTPIKHRIIMCDKKKARFYYEVKIIGEYKIEQTDSDSFYITPSPQKIVVSKIE